MIMITIASQTDLVSDRYSCTVRQGSDILVILNLQYWSACITQAQEPNPLSSRDGRRLKPVPKQWKLTQPALTHKLQEVMQKLHSMQLGLLLTAWGSSKQPDKANLALMRGFAYVQAGRFEQALKVSRQLGTPIRPPGITPLRTTQDNYAAPPVLNANGIICQHLTIGVVSTLQSATRSFLYAPCAYTTKKSKSGQSRSPPLQDARVVLVYAPKLKGQQGICSWPWAYGLHSAALEGLQVALSHRQTGQSCCSALSVTVQVPFRAACGACCVGEGWPAQYTHFVYTAIMQP